MVIVGFNRKSCHSVTTLSPFIFDWIFLILTDTNDNFFNSYLSLSDRNFSHSHIYNVVNVLTILVSLVLIGSS